MAQECGFFNAELEGGEYDRVYNAEQFAAYFASFIGNGVFGDSMSELVVTENETPNMSVNVLSGQAWINGWWYRNTEDYNLSVDVADGVLNRIDIVVLRWGSVERDMWLQVIKGTPSAEPTAPSITRDADYYDLKLCEISVPAGVINIRQAQITDTRAITEVCGFVTGLIDQIDATDLFLQFQAQFSDFMTINSEEFETWYAENTQEFNDWFEHMKDQLDSDAAGHLQNEIDAIIAEINGLLKPHFIISADTGATVTASKGQTTITATETSTGVFECDVTDYGVWTVGGKNLFNRWTYEEFKANTSGWTYDDVNKTVSYRGISLKFNDDGTIIMNGTPQNAAYPPLRKYLSLPAGSYIVSGGLSSGSSSSAPWVISVRGKNNSIVATNINGDTPFTINDTELDGTDGYQRLEIAIRDTAIGQTFNNVVIKPMIRLASIQDSTFVPYIADPVDVTVDDVKIYNVLLREDAPEGSTVTPTDDVQILLQCAGIFDKDYTTLTELMADTSTLSSVINSNNAIDYLVRSKTFIKSEALVPTMTSNTTPSGVVSASSVYSSSDMHQPYKAFDGNSNSCWYTAANVGNAQIVYHFPSAVKVGKTTVKPYYSSTGVTGLALRSFTIKGSHDGTTWSEPLYTSATLSNAEQTVTCEFENDVAYEYYEVDCTGTYRSDGQIMVAEIQYYSEAGITENSNAMSYIGLNNYASNTLLADTNEGLVPVMTSDTTPSGQCFGSTNYSSSYDWYMAFDGTPDASPWASQAVSPTHNQIGYKFPSQTQIKKARVKFGQNTSYTLQGSNDGTNWTNIITGTATVGVVKEDVINANYQYYRYDNTATNSGVGQSVYEIQFYANSESWLEGICNSEYFESVLNVKVPTMTSNTTPSGVASSSGSYSGYPEYYSFDGNDSTAWASNTTTDNVWVQYMFANSLAVFCFAIKGDYGSSGYSVVSFKISGSNDGTDFTDLYTGNYNSNVLTKYVLYNSDSYKYYRITVLSGNGRRNIYTLQFYGREDV